MTVASFTRCNAGSFAMALPQPRAGLMDLPLYEGGKSSLAGRFKTIKLSSNEAALGPSPKALAALDHAVAKTARYPDGRAAALKAAISKVHGVAPERLICGAGSDEILGLLCRAYAGPGDEVIHSAHGFLMYAIYARSVGATPVAVPERNITADVDALLGAVTERTKLLFLANPNNPTGTYLPADEIVRLRKGLREDIVLVLDGAYAEFMTRTDYDAGAALAGRTANTVMTRTFSKIYGLAALRVGWATAAPEIIAVLERLRSPFNLSTPAIEAAAAAMLDQAHVARARSHNAKWMGVAVQRLLTMGLEIVGGAGNFVLPKFPDEPGHTAADADAFLHDEAIIARRVDAYGLPDHLRITIGADDEMEAVLSALERFMGDGHA